MDYKATLEKYVGRVIDSESVHYIPVNEHDNQGLFSDEELAALREMADRKYLAVYGRRACP